MNKKKLREIRKRHNLYNPAKFGGPATSNRACYITWMGDDMVGKPVQRTLVEHFYAPVSEIPTILQDRFPDGAVVIMMDRDIAAVLPGNEHDTNMLYDLLHRNKRTELEAYKQSLLKGQDLMELTLLFIRTMHELYLQEQEDALLRSEEKIRERINAMDPLETAPEALTPAAE